MRVTEEDKIAKVIKPPNGTDTSLNLRIFLAGSIEGDIAAPWQDKFINELNEQGYEQLTVMNPRRDEWDNSWKQDIRDKNFRGQVDWELDHLDQANIIPMYFDPNTKSPISMMELGLYADERDIQDRSRLVVCCPEGFWRKGNVEIVCYRKDIDLYDNWDSWMQAIYRRIGGN